MPRFTVLAAIAAAAALALPGAAAASSCAGGDITPTTDNLVSVRHATLCLLNHERAMRGLGRLHESAKLRSAAQAYSWSMVRHDLALLARAGALP